MAGKTCPNCFKQTFFATPTGRKCSKCDYEMKVPANDGKGGRGMKCSNCGKLTVFEDMVEIKCRSCAAIYTLAPKASL
jgi:hypothetical protein